LDFYTVSAGCTASTFRVQADAEVMLWKKVLCYIESSVGRWPMRAWEGGRKDMAHCTRPVGLQNTTNDIFSIHLNQSTHPEDGDSMFLQDINTQEQMTIT
jgi:hypothetical protein